MTERSRLPGADVIDEGLTDLRSTRVSVPSLLVSIGAPRLRTLGLDVPGPIEDAEHRLYRLLAVQEGRCAHARYNALLRRLVSFERALACAS